MGKVNKPIKIENVSLIRNGMKENGFNVIVSDSRIAHIYSNAEEDRSDREWEIFDIIDGSRKLLLPGFVNTHAHSPMTLMRGYGENLNLQDWLHTKIFPFEDKLSDEAVYFATLLSIAESFKFGIVSTTDMYFFCESMANAYIDSNAKVNLGRALTCFDENRALTDMQAFNEAKSLYVDYNGAADERILVDMSLHAEYTSTPRLVRELAEYVSSINARVHVHISETKIEHEECKKRHNGLTPVAYFDSLGLFDTVSTTAAHCVYVEDSDMQIMRDKNIYVASCPVSNMKLASGIAPIMKMYERKVPITIGTDSVASNNSLNFFEEMKFFNLCAKVRDLNPIGISAKETLKMATEVGFLSQGRMDSGKLMEGAKADLILIDKEQPNMIPEYDIFSNLVFSHTGEVYMTMVDGKVCYMNGEYFTIDVEKVMAEAEVLSNIGKKLTGI